MSDDRQLRPSATERYKFAGLRLPSDAKGDLLRFLREVKYWIDLREGALGNDQERVVLQRDLSASGLIDSLIKRLLEDGRATTGNGELFDAFAEKILNSHTYRNRTALGLTGQSSDLSLLIKRIEDESAERGSEDRRLESLIAAVRLLVADTVDSTNNGGAPSSTSGGGIDILVAQVFV